MDSNSAAPWQQISNPKKTSVKKRSGCLARTVFLGLALGVFVVFVLAGISWVQVSRPLPESPHFKTSAAVLAAIKAGNGRAQSTLSFPGKQLPSWANEASSSTLPARLDQANKTSSTIIKQAMFEVIPERELAKPELKTQARRINELYRQWIDVVGLLHDRGRVNLQELPLAKTQPFGPYPFYGYYELEKEFAKTSLDAAYHKALTDACLQVLVHYENWEAASDLCRQHEQFYSWNETLLALRQIPKPLVKYPRIVVWSGGRMIASIIRGSEQKKK